MPIAPPAAVRAARPLLAVLAAAVPTALLTAAPAAAAAPSDARLERLVDDVVRAGVPAAVLAVGGARGAVRVVARGRTARGGGRPVRARDRFRVASTTKPMAATVLLRLAERGRLRLDDPVARWVPGVVDDSPGLTVRDLLRHTSGLAEYYDPDVVLAPFYRGDPAFTWPARELAARGVAASTGPVPSGRFSYNDTNYVLAGLVAEAAGGAPFPALLRREVVRPLGLRDTASEPGARRPARLVAGYADAGERTLRDASAINGSIAHAAGDVVSTAGDLVLFSRAMVAGTLLRPASRAAALRGVPMGRGLPATDRYGLGLWQTRRFGLLPPAAACQPLVGHDGSFPGYSTLMFSRRDGSRTAALVLSTDALTPRQGALAARAFRAALC